MWIKKLAKKKDFDVDEDDEGLMGAPRGRTGRIDFFATHG
jgi:hypothetical protein